MEYLRTPDEAFDGLPDFDFSPHYLQQQGLRQHYLDEGSGEVVLCLHGEPTWSFLYRQFIPVLRPHCRVVVPDWFGFGRSDKPVRRSDYTLHFHLRTLENFIRQLHLRDITLVVQDWGGPLGLALVGQQPQWFRRLVIMNTFLPVGGGHTPFLFKAWRFFSRYAPILPIGMLIRLGTYRSGSRRRAILRAYRAPFPTARYKAGPRAFPALAPTGPTDPGLAEMRQAEAVLQTWTKPCLLAFSDRDPVFSGEKIRFERLIPAAVSVPGGRIRRAGHLLQEDAGTEIAGYILEWMRHDGSGGSA